MARPTVMKNHGNQFSQYSDVTNGRLVRYLLQLLSMKYDIKIQNEAI